MSLLSNIPNLRVEDFPKQQEWIGRLFVSLNPFIQGVGALLNGNIDFSSNIKSVTKDYAISSFQQFSFLWPYAPLSPSDVKITKATKGAQKTPTILLCAWSYNPGTKTVTISRLTEIDSADVSSTLAESYYFTIRAVV